MLSCQSGAAVEALFPGANEY